MAANATAKKYRSKFFRVAVEGATTCSPRQQG